MSNTIAILGSVIGQLKAFLLFYLICSFMMSLLVSVLGLANNIRPGAFKDGMVGQYDPNDASQIPGTVYLYIPKLIGNLIYVMRTSMGDFELDGLLYLSDFD